MFTGLTRQEQRALILLGVIAVGGIAYHQIRGDTPADGLVIDAETGHVLFEPASPEWVSPAEMTAQGPLIDLNTASLTELMTLPGIGEVRARSIVEDRERWGPFRTLEDVTRISGIGEGTLARLRGVATVGGAASPSPAAPVPIAGTVEEAPAPVAQRQPAPEPSAAPGLVNVNTATRDELMTLPGIGEVLADRIIQHREAHGPFHRVEDLTAVPRIGDRTAERLRPLVTF